MARNAGASKQEVEAIIGKYKQSGLSRQAYCEQEGITVYTLDYYQRRMYKLREREAAKSRVDGRGAGPTSSPQVRLARVEVRGETPTATSHAATMGFTMSLANGRRIEVPGWGFPEQELARLIRLAERT